MMTFKVTPDDGEPYEVTARSRDVFVWEKTTKGTMGQLAQGAPMVDLYHLAYLAAKRTGLFDGSLADFSATVDLDFDGLDDEPDPTHAAPGAAS